MTHDHPTVTDRPDERQAPLLGRRRLLALTGSAGAALLAGCSGDGGSDDPTGGTGGSGGNGGSDGERTATATEDTRTGTFRLLISDQPVAIDEFDSLEVSLDRARVFRSSGGDGQDGDDQADETETLTATATATNDGNETAATANATASPTATADAEEESEEADGEKEQDGERNAGDEEKDGEDGESGGFSVVELDGATVDLTQVLGEKALSVFEGGLPAGRYTKIELHAADVGGVVDGEPVDVKLPSGKLQITRPFDVAAGETLSFVFDITVVKKGNGGYNLKPVISESGVAGKDVEVEEVSEGEATAEGDGTDGEEQDDEDAGANGGSAEEGTETPAGGESGRNDDGGQPDDGTATPTDG